MNKTRYESEWFDRNALGIAIYKDEAFAYMAKAGKLAAHILDHVAQFVVAGVSTLELNDICHAEIIRHGAIPAPLNYRGFPKSICTSINNVICHGIPAENIKLKSGDIINIDVTVILDGWYGDTSRMFAVGKISPLATRLINATHDALMGAISIVKPNATFFDIGKKIAEIIKPHRFSIVRDFCGHGIGRIFHDEPQVVHYPCDELSDTKIEKGMIFTIEPMINAGRYESVMLSDGWTSVTKDGSLSAQFEHTIGVTESGSEIFTLSTTRN